MSTSDSTIKGKFDEVAGKVKQGVGEAFGSQRTANDGAAQEVKGHAEQAWGSVKEAAHDSSARHTDAVGSTGTVGTTTGTNTAGHDIRESITSTAQNLKEKIQHGTSDHKDRY